MDSVDWQDFARPLALLTEMKHLIKTCLLCHSNRIYVIGVFIPDPNNQQLFFDTVPPGVLQERYYGLCKGCFRRSRQSRCQIVEDKFIAMIAAERERRGQTVQ